MVYEGDLSGRGLKLAIVVARWNSLITRELLVGAQDSLRRQGVAEADIDVVWVPGAFEIPVAARWLAESGRYQAIVALGAVIRGGTPHFEHVSAAALGGIAALARETGLPIAAGILTTDSSEQALERAGIKAGNKGAEAAQAAVEMATLGRRLREAGGGLG